MKPGDRVDTPRGPGTVTELDWKDADWHERHRRQAPSGTWVVVNLDRGGPRIFARREVDELPEGAPT